MSTAQPLKVATPLTATTGLLVQLSTAPPPLTRASVTDAVLLVTRLPVASRTATTGCVLHGVCEVPPPGCVVTASWVAVPAVNVTLTGLLLCVSAVPPSCALKVAVPALDPETVAV